MFNGPWLRICRGKPTERHPLNMQLTPHQSIDFWGPCLVVSVYILILWLGNVRDGTWTYVIWTITSIFNHFVMRSYNKSTLLMHMSILGYSIAPMIPFSTLILLILFSWYSRRSRRQWFFISVLYVDMKYLMN